MKKKTNEFKIAQSSSPVMGNPKDVADMLNKYGTYETQPTSDNDNKYPQIAQGLPKNKYRKEKTKKS